MKNKKEGEVEELDESVSDKESNSFCFKILTYTVHADRFQYILSGYSKVIPGVLDKNGKPKRMQATGYFQCLSQVIAEIREIELKVLSFDSGSLDILLDKMVKFELEFRELLKPLKKHLESMSDDDSRNYNPMAKELKIKSK